MSIEISANINTIMTDTDAWPQGTISTTLALHKRGYSGILIDKYRRSRWLVSVGNGAVARRGDHVEWTGGLYAIQTQLGLPVHAGGKTALQFHGHTHFVSSGRGGSAWLFSRQGTRLPTWFTNHAWNVGEKPLRLQHINTNLFGQKHALGLTEIKSGTYKIRISSRERAMMELLHLVPNDQGFEEAAALMQQLSTLQPELTTDLLRACRSVKVKRLFLFLADHCNHPWLAKIDRSKIYMGSGKRQIVKDGEFDSKYSITVPRGFIENPDKENRP
ncbi:MAG: hypothetical protein A2583_03515 [Bdellovibrionales bacterium RIFOXYD1_FULL_53_11]|nr:MAG: hypothetical protein A2583_03515 [Bdellovibrionales bacterium RIFOXYD1_FULL_53_11]